MSKTVEQADCLAELFASALEVIPDERAAFLAAACGDDQQLRREVEALLAAHERDGDFMRRPAVELAAGSLLNSEPSLLAGRHIGSYKLIERIAEGGMGAVWLAVRADEQFEQRVAIKVIRHGRRGTDHDSIIRRFRHERQILAALHHPHIARLLDGGTTEDGLPWFALEYIEGQPLTAYCERRRLSLDERLQLFLTICDAVQYAHRNLVIHRDLKPSNILVTKDGAPKLLDFGIAKLLHPEQPDETLDLTLTGTRPMTPAYAAPEQVRGEQITTASDVYSLGVILYELLTGRRPYRISANSPREIERIISEQEPLKPSLAIAGGESERASVSQIEQPERLARRLRGDLDNVVLMALRKEPERRYASVEQLAEDVRRYLDGLPVMASRGTAAYRGAKFVRRHKAGVVAAALVALSLVAGMIATAWQARVARRQATLAQREKEKAERIGAFLQTTLSYANPNWDAPGYGRGPDVKLADAIRDAENRIDTELKEQPEIRAELHHVIGKVWLFRGEYAAAEQSFRRALALRRQFYGEWHPQIAETLCLLADTIAELGQSEAAETLNRQAVAMMRALEPENEQLYWQILDLGGRLLTNGKREEGEQAILEALDQFRRRFGEQHKGTALAYKRLANSYSGRGKLDQALAIYRGLIAQSRHLPTHQEMADVWYNQGKIEYYKGDYQAAEQSLNESVKIFQQVQGADSPFIARVLYMLAVIYCRQQRYEEAIREAQRAVEIGQRKRPPGHPQLITALGVLSQVLISAGQVQRAAPSLREAASQYWAQPVRKTVEFQDAAGVLGECFTLLHRYTEAEPFLKECYASLIASRSEKSSKMAEARRRLAQLYDAWGFPEQAAQFRDAAATIAN